jgi:FdhE protein
MVTLEEIAAARPHLRDALRLYEKVMDFNALTSDLAVFSEAVAYPAGSIDELFKSFSSAFDMPEDMLDPLREAMKLGQIDLTRLPLNEVPAFSLPYHEDELLAILFLISKPYFLRLKGSLNVHDVFWEKGRCPVCKSAPSLSFIKRDEGRTLYCSYCESRGQWHRIGCPHCQNRDSDRLEIIETEEEKGFRIDLCNVCRSYMKTIDDTLLNDYTPGLLDIISLPFDILAQERAYKRLSPNPIGVRKMA